jgi:hypothetical protein
MIEIELIVGTMGLDKVLADKLPKYSKGLLDKAGSTLKSLKAGAADFATKNQPGSMPDETYGLSDYEELQEMLTGEQEIVDAVEGLASWPTEFQMEVSVLVADIKAYLGQQLPQQQVTGSFSGTFVTPSDSDQFRFLWQANLIDDIRRFVDLLNSGSITPLESALMRTLFPQTHDYLIVEVMDKVLDAVVTGKADAWEGSWRKPALSGLLGVPIMNFSDVMGYQTGHEEKTAGRPKQANAVQIANVNLTDNQKIDTKTVDQSK